MAKKVKKRKYRSVAPLFDFGGTSIFVVGFYKISVKLFKIKVGFLKIR